MLRLKTALSCLLVVPLLAMAACSTSDEEPISLGGSGGGTCNQQVRNFRPCGGDIEGVWTIRSICLHPFEVETSCKGYEVEMRHVLLGESVVTFADGLFSVSGGRVRLETESRFSVSCLDGLECSDVSYDWTSHGCEGTRVCSCSDSFEDDMQSGSWAYSTDGDRLMIDDGVDGARQEYCVRGDMLYINSIALEEEGFSSLLTLERR